jgi:hypothetical protein
MKLHGIQPQFGEFLAYVVGLVLILTLSCYWGVC